DFDPANWPAGHGAIAVTLSELHTGIDQRDQDMREEFFQTGRYPKAILVIDKVERASAAAIAPGQSVEGEAVGTFEVHGVRRAIRFPMKMKMEADRRVQVSGSFEVPFADYSIQRPQRLFLKLGDTAEVSFELYFAPGASSAAAAA